MPEKASGVLYCLGGISAGFTVYLDEGVPKAEYNAMTISRSKIASPTPIPKGKVIIEVDLKYDSQERESPATVTFAVNGKRAGQGRITRSVPAAFTASETFDVGMDLGSPVALDYHARKPFKFNGKIARIQILYTDRGQIGARMNPDDD